MKILIDICHPAHAHFFRYPMELLKEAGHELIITSRSKEMSTILLDGMGIDHRILSVHSSGSPFGLFRELILRDWRLYRLIRQWRPDVMAAIGGIFISHAGFLSRVPSLVFYDTENASLQNALTYPLASRLYVPQCYSGWVPERRTTRYDGYHELSYLHPRYFKPDRRIALENGLAPEGQTFLIRKVSWQASHDMGEIGWNLDLLRTIVARLGSHGRVLISSEADLPPEFSGYRYSGAVSAIHHVMSYCRGYIGESATMASECAVLGVPAVYAAATGRSYTDEQEGKFGLVRNVRSLSSSAIDGAIGWILSRNSSSQQRARDRLLEQTIDVAAFVAHQIERNGTGTYASPLRRSRR